MIAVEEKSLRAPGCDISICVVSKLAFLSDCGLLRVSSVSRECEEGDMMSGH